MTLTGIFDMGDYLTRDEVKAAMKEALHEWLDKQWAYMGKWTFGGIASTALGALVYAYFKTHGFTIK
jgi:hypothetical protein